MLCGKPTGCISISMDNALQQSTDFIDRHIVLFKNAPYVLLGIGGFLIARKLRVTSQFKSVQSIPPEFVAKHVSLRGYVVTTSTDCVIHVRHVPIIKWPVRDSASASVEEYDDCFPIHLAGISIPESMRKEAVEELKQLNDSLVWFQICCRSVDENEVGAVSRLHCVVYRRKWPLNVNVNKLLVSRGLALFVPFPDHSSYFKTWRKLARQLVHAEKRASKKRLGIWSEPTRTQRLVAEASRRYERLRSKSPAELMGAFYGWLCAGVRKILKRNKDI